MILDRFARTVSIETHPFRLTQSFTARSRNDNVYAVELVDGEATFVVNHVKACTAPLEPHEAIINHFDLSYDTTRRNT